MPDDASFLLLLAALLVLTNLLRDLPDLRPRRDLGYAVGLAACSPSACSSLGSPRRSCLFSSDRSSSWSSWYFLTRNEIRPLTRDRAVFRMTRADQRVAYADAAYVGAARFVKAVGCSRGAIVGAG